MAPLRMMFLPSFEQTLSDGLVAHAVEMLLDDPVDQRAEFIDRDGDGDGHRRGQSGAFVRGLGSSE